MRDLITRIVITAKDKTAAGIQSAKSGFASFLEKIGLASSKTDDLAQASKNAAEEQKELDQQNQSLARSLKQSALAIGGFIGAAFGLNKIREGLSAILNTGGKFEILNAQLEAVMGTAAGGQAAFAWIKNFAKTTPLQLEEVTEAFIKMKAFGLDPMDGTMQKLVDVSSKLGGGQERLNGIILGVGQAWTKQKLQAEEANQLIERGVPVWELLSTALGKTTAEIQELAAKGQIGRQEIALLIDEIGRSSEGAAAAQMATWNGLISNLKDTWTQFLDTIAQSGALEYFKAQLEAVSAKIQEMATDGSLQQLAQSISNGFITAAESVKKIITTLFELREELVLLAKAFVAVKIARFITGLNGVASAAIESTKATVSLKTALASLKSAIPTAVLAFTITQVTKLTAGMINWGAAILDTAKAQRELDKNTQDRLKILKQEAEQLGINIKQYRGNITAIVDAIRAKKKETEATKKATEATRDFDAEVAALAASGEKASDTVKALAEKTGLANSEVIRLTTSTQGIITQFHEWENSADGLEKSLQKVADKDLAAMIDDMTAAIETGAHATDTMKQRLNELTEESLRRMGIAIDLTKDNIKDFGKVGAANFKAVSTSAKLTKQQLEALRIEMILLAETPEQLKQLKEEFKKQGETLITTNKVAEVYRKTLERLKNQTDLTAASTKNLGSAYGQMAAQAQAAMAPLHDEINRLRAETAALRAELERAVSTPKRYSIGKNFDPRTQERVNQLSPEEFARFQAAFERAANSNTSKSTDRIVSDILSGIERDREKQQDKAKKKEGSGRPSVSKQVTIQFDDPRGGVHMVTFDDEQAGEDFISMMNTLGGVTL